MELSVDLLQSIHTNQIDVHQLRANVIQTITEIDYLRQPITNEMFFKEYLMPNKLCVLGRWATEGWRSRGDWVTGDGKPNVTFLREHFGGATCPIANCNEEKYSSHPKQAMKLSEFLDYMTTYAKDGYPPDKSCLYLKDWHFQKKFPEYMAYEVPPFFKSDWMNEFWDRRTDLADDYRFVYIGPKGSWTPFHADVFRSYSWSANICGRKKWIFFPPGQEEYLRDKFGQLVFDLNSPELEHKDRFPASDQVEKRFEIYQEEGEVVFVPSGWHHQVFNLEDTISINHNWMNACNADLCWRHLVNSLADVQKEINDCRDMEDWGNQCQLILKASAGMDYSEFYRFMTSIANNRIKALSCRLGSESQILDTTVISGGTILQNNESIEPSGVKSDVVCDINKIDCQDISYHKGIDHRVLDQETVAEDYEFQPCCRSDGQCKCGFDINVQNHFLFDLIKIQKLVLELKQNKEFLQIDLDQFDVRPKKLVDKINKVIDHLMANT